jgi:predicted Zn-dependent protease
MIDRVIARIALACAAVAAAAWLGVGLHSTRLTAKAEQLSRRPFDQAFSASEVDRIQRLFERARRHNPDVTPLIDEGAFLTRNGRPRRGIALVEEAVRREPSNAVGWAVLVYAAARFDPERWLEARRKLAELRPPLRSER